MRIGPSTSSSRPPPSSSSSSSSAAGGAGLPPPTTARPEGVPPSASGDGNIGQGMASFAQSFMFNQVQKNMGQEKEKWEKLNQPDPDEDTSDSGIYGD